MFWCFYLQTVWFWNLWSSVQNYGPRMQYETRPPTANLVLFWQIYVKSNYLTGCKPAQIDESFLPTYLCSIWHRYPFALCMWHGENLKDCCHHKVCKRDKVTCLVIRTYSSAQDIQMWQVNFSVSGLVLLRTQFAVFMGGKLNLCPCHYTSTSTERGRIWRELCELLMQYAFHKSFNTPANCGFMHSS